MRRLKWALGACAFAVGIFVSVQTSSPEGAAICGGATVLCISEALSTKEKKK